MTWVDRTSKTIVAAAAADTDMSSEAIALLTFREIYCRFGLPLNLTMDNDVKFVSSLWKSLWHLCGTKLRFTSSYNPQSDPAERATIMRVYMCVVNVSVCEYVYVNVRLYVRAYLCVDMRVDTLPPALSCLKIFESESKFAKILVCISRVLKTVFQVGSFICNTIALGSEGLALALELNKDLVMDLKAYR